MTAPAEAAPIEPTAPATPTPETPPSPANMPARQTSAAAAPTTADPAGDEPKPSHEEKELTRARKDAATYREQLRNEQAAVAAEKAEWEKERAKSAATEEMLAKLAAILNPDANQPPDPALLAEQLVAEQAKTAKVEADYQQKIRDLTIRAALPGALARAQAKAVTEKVLIADGVLAKLDPMSDTFEADLASAVNAALEADPDLKVAPAATRSQRSGPEIPGRSGGSNQITRAELAGMKPADIDKARKEGRLTSLGVGPG
jgi:hypothetical protein